MSYKSRKKKAKKILKSYEGKETSIERKIRLFLNNEGLYFKQEYAIKHKFKKAKRELYKVYDFYVYGMTPEGKQYRFLIEVHGDYWHCKDYLEGKIEKNKLHYTQKKNLRNDKLKDRIAKDLGIPLIILWEKDIKWDFEKCVNIIRNMTQ